MEFQNPASNLAAQSDSNWDTNSSTGSSPVGLNLEIRCCGSNSDQKVDSSNIKCPAFTFLQLQELQLQSLIYIYMEAGLPVPYHLVQPIWKSFSSSLGFLTVLGISPLHLDSMKGMDPQPWRCRRTDGKKWRCSKEALPDNKYCERHVHRGRPRSTSSTSQHSSTPN